ncbi:sugar phosphate isomerase/epimerase [Microbacterium aoyamense]|uniref:Sugar phosphate isomerase/epimerase n=1 Tax=Microbacterium aoyamense TaxID=344166 RepID=A0ABN2PXF0_9MICO|nr:sugar phosphate isomerase/epimerase [Microbacterium aoyamense]
MTASLGVQLYSVKDHIGPDDLPRTLERLASMGFTHAEPYDILSDTDGLRRAAANAGLRLETAHAPLLVADRTRVLDAAAALGIHTLLVPWTEPDGIRDAAGVQRLAAGINAAASSAAEGGMRVGYHNHEFEFAQTVDGKPVYERLVELLEPEVVLELDTFWASIGGADVFELIPRLRERVRYLHVKNEPPDPGDPPFAGTDITGRLDEVLAVARGIIDHPVVEIVVDEGDVFPVLERNARYFRELDSTGLVPA